MRKSVPSKGVNSRNKTAQESAQPATPAIERASELTPTPGGNFDQSAFQRHAAILRRVAHPMYTSQRVLVMRQIQSDYGNRYAQRLVEYVQRGRAEEGQAVRKSGFAGEPAAQRSIKEGSESRAEVTVESRSQSSSPEGAIQRTQADISVNGSNRGTGNCGLGEGAGGIDHAEQRAWGQASASVDGRFADVSVDNVIVTFDVDQTICPACQDWFEGTLFNYLSGRSTQNGNKAFELNVVVNGTTVRVLGTNETRWPENVGDDPRLPIVEQLRNMLVETGGLSEDKITVYDAAGSTTDYVYYGEDDLERVLREYQDEIQESYDNWQDFQDTGMVRVGDRREIDMEALEAEKADVY